MLVSLDGSVSTAIVARVDTSVDVWVCPAVEQRSRDVVLVDSCKHAALRYPALEFNPAVTTGLAPVSNNEDQSQCIVAYSVSAVPTCQWSLEGSNDGQRWTALDARRRAACRPGAGAFVFLPVPSHFKAHRLVGAPGAVLDKAGLQVWAPQDACCHCSGLRVAMSGAPGFAALVVSSPDRSYAATVCKLTEVPGGTPVLQPLVPRLGAWCRLQVSQASDGALRVAVDGSPAVLQLQPGSRSTCALFGPDHAGAPVFHLGGVAASALPGQPKCAPPWQALRASLASMSEPHREPGLAVDAAAYPGSSLGCFTGYTWVCAAGTPPPALAPSPAVRRCAAPLESVEDVLAWQPGGGPAGCDDAALRCRVPLRAHALAPSSSSAFGATSVLNPSGPPRPLVLVCHDCGPAVYKEDSCSEGWRARAGNGTALPLPLGLVRGSPGAATPLVSLLPETQPDSAEDAAWAAARYPGSSACRAVASPPLVPPGLLPQEQPPLPDIGAGYVFQHWQHTDVFVYFSHARVSLPPPGWTEAGHTHGTRVLGTLVTEWRDGAAANAAMLQRPHAFADQLAAIAAYYGFDGWLVNIEADVTPQPPAGEPDAEPSAWTHESAALADFLRALTLATKAAVPGGLVIAYDSIDGRTGRVAWQSALVPAANGRFLDACDGLFLDYHWSAEKLAATAAAAACAGRVSDVFVGIDVWGRGMPGGGKWRSAHAVAAVREAHPALSLAVFGPAWTYEAEGGKAGPAVLAELDHRLWTGEGVVGPEDAEEAAAAAAALPHVCNPSGGGACALPHADTTSRAPSCPAPMAGWEVLASGGEGWGVEALRPCDAPVPATPAPACFVTSHKWCGARQFIPLASAAASFPGAALRVVQWVSGAGPNPADPYRVRAWLATAADAAEPEEARHPRYLPLRCAAHAQDSVQLEDPTSPPVACSACSAFLQDTGVRLAGREWRQVALTFPAIPAPAAGVVLELWGRDAETWGGHYGARFCDAQVQLLRSPAVAAAAGLVGSLARGSPRPARPLALSTHPNASPLLSTTWCNGFGRAVFAAGRVADPRPWVDLRATAVGPAYTGHAPVATGLGALERAVQAAAAEVDMAPLLRQLGAACQSQRSASVALPWGGAAAASLAFASEGLSHLATQVVHDWAWEGGSSLLLTSRLPPGSATPSVSVCLGRVLAVDWPPPVADTRKSIQVQLIVKTAEAQASDNSTDDNSNTIIMVMVALVAAGEGGGGRQQTLLLPTLVEVQPTSLPACAAVTCSFDADPLLASGAAVSEVLLLHCVLPPEGAARRRAAPPSASTAALVGALSITHAQH